MKINSIAKLGGVVLLSVLVLAGCGSKSSQSGSKKQELRWQESSNLPTMDLSKATDQVSAETLNATNEGLLKMSTNAKVTPGVAKNYTVSKDGKTWTFNLRHSKWSDGTPVTAKDFVYSWQRTLTPKTASQYAYIFDHIKNATKVNAGKAPVSSLGVKADGDYKLVVTLNRPQSYFKYLVANAEFFPQKESAVKKYGSKYGTQSKYMVYNGPFKLTGWNGTNDSWTMVKNNDYWNKKNIKLDKMKIIVSKDPSTTLNQYNTNKLDAITLSGSQQVSHYKNDKNYKSYLNASTFYLEMNQKKDPVLRNVNIRKAISMSINRKQLTNKVFADGSVPARGLVAAKMAYRNGKDYADQAEVKSADSQNLAEARKLWAKGLKETGKKSVSLNLLSDDTPAGKNSTEFLQSQLTKLPGLKITNQNLPFKTRLQRSQDGNFDLVISAWIADFPDPISFLSLFTSDNSYNNGKWKNSEYDTLVKNAEGKDALNAGKRWDDMVQAQKVLMNNQGIVPLYQQSTPKLINSKVKGVQFFPTAPEWDWSKVSIK
ncbi:MAG: peptide ABC transporter substrate-binding protein [Lentilactobacillus buchneri]|jgi:oligopeptide transport system substrate-binding protein|nr:peptide ABC transporter substrate-binding protein [Lentilactobacillus buchneri]